ncbi:hypothetical protein [Patulibacter defluvii]|uniref:hypothetical protein n=1 Tax=Patulibacter defluvii TaxID=3095358 RepID=UPI002A74B2C0|nr:hypothetical protein [Patulibacter sp. DM4]
MAFDLPWMRPQAPYMPIATVGLLTAISDAGLDAQALWRRDLGGEVLEIRSEATAERAAQAIVDAPWPQLDRIWPGQKVGQAIKPMLAATSDPAQTLRNLRRRVDEQDAAAKATGDPRLIGEQRLLRALVTDAVLDDGGVPSRSRLLRGVKADLSGIAEKLPLKVPDLARELTEGPVWRNGKSGRGLGLVPEVQTFGGTTGRKPSDVGSHSVLLYRLLWLGILALHPVGVRRGTQRIVGGPLFTDLVSGEPTLSWPTWSFPVGARELARLLDVAAIHVASPDPRWLAARGITGVHRASSVPINSMIGVFRWGERVA